ncbi:hypothetical protein RDI58_018356 [Solanum bulbocastanum]|uniref:Uncharacterized protein n=1 Tax=Solanum bulbocastanum TaxID=147425 RepID=A0AAN8YAW0_SOLBU
MHLGWIFVNDESDMDTKSLDSDGKEVLSWQALFDLIVFKIMTFCDLWFDFECDMKTWAKIWPWEEIEKSLVLLTEVWVLISMDFIDGLPKSHGHEVIVIVVDRPSMVILFPLKHSYTT